VINRRPAGDVHVDAHLFCEDVRERGLAEPRRPRQKNVVQRLAAASRGLDVDPQIFLVLVLSDEVPQATGSKNSVEFLILRVRTPFHESLTLESVSFGTLIHKALLPGPVPHNKSAPIALGRLRS
jgi:hypothetical protein